MKIMIAMPASNSIVTTLTVRSLMETAPLLGARKIEYVYETTSLSDIESSRNILASRCLADASFSHLLFVDSDMGFRPSLIGRMIDCGKEFVSAVYVQRDTNVVRMLEDMRRNPDEPGRVIARNMNYNVAPLVDAEGRSTFSVERGFASVNGTGMGICLLHRNVFATMLDKKVAFPIDPSVFPDVKHPIYTFFDRIRDDWGRLLSEDYAFCRRWVRGCGGEIWACLDEVIEHVGPYVHVGQYLEYLKSRNESR
jgi:hypothetical protein